MTTDNRTNEPTPEQVEAAARVIWKMDSTTLGAEPPESLEAWEFETEGYLELARAVLEAAARAAQGAAPQAEAYDHCCQHPKCPGGSLCCCMSEQRLRDCWNQWRGEIAGDSRQAFRDGYQAGRNDPAPWLTAPVLPSSGVDEEKLAEVIQAHVLGDPNGGTATWVWVICSCGHRVEIAGVTREHVVALGRKHQARAVAEWLKGQRGESHGRGN